MLIKRAFTINIFALGGSLSDKDHPLFLPLTEEDIDEMSNQKGAPY